MLNVTTQVKKLDILHIMRCMIILHFKEKIMVVKNVLNFKKTINYFFRKTILSKVFQYMYSICTGITILNFKLLYKNYDEQFLKFFQYY